MQEAGSSSVNCRLAFSSSGLSFQYERKIILQYHVVITGECSCISCYSSVLSTLAIFEKSPFVVVQLLWYRDSWSTTKDLLLACLLQCCLDPFSAGLDNRERACGGRVGWGRWKQRQSTLELRPLEDIPKTSGLETAFA